MSPECAQFEAPAAM